MYSVAESKKVGDLLREWRGRRRLSQLDLAYETEISQRHLSFVEIGRAQPSRDMILRLAEKLNIPLRERNVLLAAGGFAAVFPERPLDDKSFAAARKAVDLILNGLEPNPAFVVDRHWTLISTNKAGDVLLSSVDESLRRPSVNMLEICLHPKGLTPQIINYEEWRGFILDFVRQQIELTADGVLIELLQKLKSYPKPKPLRSKTRAIEIDSTRIAVPLRLARAEGEMSFLVSTTVFGTPIDITLSELAIEVFFPADEKTAEILQRFF